MKTLNIAIMHYKYNLKKHINAYLAKSKKFCFTKRNLQKILRKSTEIVSSTWFPFNSILQLTPKNVNKQSADTKKLGSVCHHAYLREVKA